MPRSLKIHRELETSLRELFFEWSVPDAATMSPPPLQREAFEDRVFLFLVLGVSLAFVWILRPYAGAILWGTVLAIVFAPLNRHLRDRLRQRRTIAAAVTLLVIVILVLFPVALIVSSLIDEDAWSFVWVVDAPLFEPADEATAAGDVAVGSGQWTAVHHAFTSPKSESMDTFDVDPSEALAYAYDIVCNGNEIGGGSIRIHREDVQKRVF